MQISADNRTEEISPESQNYAVRPPMPRKDRPLPQVPQYASCVRTWSKTALPRQLGRGSGFQETVTDGSTLRADRRCMRLRLLVRCGSKFRRNAKPQHIQGWQKHQCQCGRHD